MAARNFSSFAGQFSPCGRKLPSSESQSTMSKNQIGRRNRSLYSQLLQGINPGSLSLAQLLRHNETRSCRDVWPADEGPSGRTPKRVHMLKAYNHEPFTERWLSRSNRQSSVLNVRFQPSPPSRASCLRTRTIVLQMVVLARESRKIALPTRMC